MISGSRYVSTAMVSQALGVSVTTVKRWVDEGILPAHKTVGGHRKVVVSDVLRLIREKNLPHVNLSKLIPHSKVFNLADSKSIVSQLLNALQNIHQDSVADIILHAYDHGFAVEDLADSIITPTLHQFDQLVAADKISLLQKYRAHQVMLASLYPLRQAIHAQKQPGQPIAIGGSPEHDSNAISTLLAKLTLLDNGWNAFNLGPSVPLQAFSQSLTEFKPSLVWLSVSVIPNAERFLEEYGQFYSQAKERDIPVAVTGVGLTPQVRERMPYTTFGDCMSHLAAFAETIYRRHPDTHSPSPKMLDPRHGTLPNSLN